MIALYAQRRQWTIGDVRVDVTYDSASTPRELDVAVHLPDGLSEDQIIRLTRVVKTCPVARAFETGFTVAEHISQQAIAQTLSPLGRHLFPELTVQENLQMGLHGQGCSAAEAKNRIAGVRLRASDTNWQHGEGPEAAGPIIAILLAMTGRKAALDDLTGDGVAVLRERA